MDGAQLVRIVLATALLGAGSGAFACGEGWPAATLRAPGALWFFCGLPFFSVQKSNVGPGFVVPGA